MIRSRATDGCNSEDFPPFALTVDLVALTIESGELKVLLVQRGEEPYKGGTALPGGLVHPDEDLPDAASRQLAEQTGLVHPPGHLEQLRTYGDPGRHPRKRVVSVAYLALAAFQPQPHHGGAARYAAWVPVSEATRSVLAFDHSIILADGLERTRAKLEYTSLATSFCPPDFTVADLRHVYEVVWGHRIDPRNFHRKVTGIPGLLVEAGSLATGGRGRPAAVYRRGPAEVLNPPIARTETAAGQSHPKGLYDHGPTLFETGNPDQT